MPKRPKIAFIGTGGTIASMGATTRELQDYGANGVMLQTADLVARVPELAEIAEIIAVPFAAVPSPNIYFPEWQGLVRLCDQLVADYPDLSGIVIGHGTASLEETAYMLNLTVKVAIPVVVVGSRRRHSRAASVCWCC